MTVQAVLFGPLLGFSFLAPQLLSIAAVVSDRRVALAASLLISLGGTIVLRPPRPGLRPAPHSVLHVPFHVISLATAQSLGWVLLVPCLSLTFLAHRHFTRTRAWRGGPARGPLPLPPLTFLNVPRPSSSTSCS